MSDLSLLQDFIAETGEHLEELEANLLQLETDPDNRDILNDIFRAMHTIKGSSEYLGMEKIARLSHKLENLLEMLRQGELTLDRVLIDTLIEARDRIAGLIDDLERTQSEATEVEDVIERIEQLSRTSGEEGEQSGYSAGHDQKSETTHDESLPAPSSHTPEEVETYEEDADQELFEIFIQQLQEKLHNLASITQELTGAQNPGQVLDDIRECIDSLKSSANYMGYEKLIRVYESWTNAIGEFRATLTADGEAASLQEFIRTDMQAHIDQIRRRFPQIKNMEALSGKPPAPAAAPKLPEDLPAQTDLLEMENLMDELLSEGDGAHQDLFPDMEDAEFPEEECSLFEDDESPGLLPDETSAAGVSEDQELSKMLSQALDASIGAPLGPKSDDFQSQMETQLFSQCTYESPDAITEESSSGEGEFLEEAKSAITANKATDIKADEALADRRENKTDPMSGQALPPVEEDVARQEAPALQQAKANANKQRMIKQSVRVDARKIDALMNQVGELVVSRAWFSQLFNEMQELQQYLKQTARLDQKEMKQVRNLTFRLSEATVGLGRVANDLQEGVMKVRMLPIAQLFNRYPRLVRDLVQDTGKQVQLEIKGEDTELDKMIIEEISDPLIHIIRNAVDHGIETAELRKKHGKPEVGTMRLEAYHESNHVVIEILDDGKGIDPDQIKTAALDKDLTSAKELDRMAPREILGLIMKPGFSTAQQVTHTSGRGVGMDVVKRNVENLNGTIEIDSEVGVGTRFRIKIPLTLAIIHALLVRVGSELFTIPLATVEETLRIDNHDTSTIEGVEVIHLRDRTLPLVRLSDVFKITPNAPDIRRSFVVIVSTGMRRVGLLVDALIGQEEVVIKPLVDYLQENSGFSGATVLGDGRISLILDVYELVNISIEKQAKRRSRAAA